MKTQAIRAIHACCLLTIGVAVLSCTETEREFAGDSGAGGGLCEPSFRWCQHEFTYHGDPDHAASSVEVRGSFRDDGWRNGVPLVYSEGESVWKASVLVPHNQPVTYQFVVVDSGVTRWESDAKAAIAEQNGFGDGQTNSVLPPVACASPQSLADRAPCPCPTRTNMCQFTFVFPDDGYAKVALMGSFDDWSTQGRPMVLVKGLWTATVGGLRRCEPIQFKFKIDDVKEYIKDSDAAHNRVPNEHGEYNSLISSVTCD